MHRYLINFKKSTRDRAAELSTRAYNHYLRLKPFAGKIYQPLKEIHNKYFGKFYGKN